MKKKNMERVNMDILAEMTDHDLANRYDYLVTQLDSRQFDRKQVEIELAYVLREHDLRYTQHVSHTEYLKLCK